jgi:hypothetical protein
MSTYLRIIFAAATVFAASATPITVAFAGD